MGVRDFFDIVELRTKAVSVTSFALGTLAAVHAGARFSWPVAALTFVSVLCVDMGTTAFNSFFDWERRVDDARFNRERDKVIVHGNVAPGWAIVAGLALYALAAPIGMALAVLRGVGVLAVGAAGMSVGFFYNGGPRPISHTPFGELASGGFLGAILFLLSYYVQAGRLTPDAWLASVPLLLLVGSILTVNNTCDIEGDRAAGRRTLSILVGARAAEALVYALGSLAYLAAAAGVARGALPAWAAVPLAAAFAGTLVTYRGMHRRRFLPRDQGAADGRHPPGAQGVRACVGRQPPRRHPAALARPARRRRPVAPRRHGRKASAT